MTEESSHAYILKVVLDGTEDELTFLPIKRLLFLFLTNE